MMRGSPALFPLCGDQFTGFTFSPVKCAAKARISAVSSIILSVGLPAPWRTRIYIRTRCGLMPRGRPCRPSRQESPMACGPDVVIRRIGGVELQYVYRTQWVCKLQNSRISRLIHENFYGHGSQFDRVPIHRGKGSPNDQPSGFTGT